MSFDAGIYPKFVEKRIGHMVTALGERFFKGKRVMEAGCGYGYAGELLEKIGATVISIDGRPEHVEVVKQRYPNRETAVVDFNCGLMPDKYDVIVAIGLLYHLADPGHFLAEAAKACNAIAISTIVIDGRPGEMLMKVQEKPTYDQCLTGVAHIPSPEWIQGELATLGFSWMDISSAKANIEGNRFDWVPQHKGGSNRDSCYLRKMYVGEKV